MQPMQVRRTLFILLICCCLLIAFTALLFAVKREPTFQGESLSTWVGQYYRDGKDEDAQAIRAIGSRAVPYLLIWIDYKPSPWKRTLGSAVAFAPFLQEALSQTEEAP